MPGRAAASSDTDSKSSMRFFGKPPATAQGPADSLDWEFLASSDSVLFRATRDSDSRDGDPGKGPAPAPAEQPTPVERQEIEDTVPWEAAKRGPGAGRQP